MTPANEPDSVLIDKFRRGDSGAFDTLVLRYQQNVFNIIYHTLGRTENADDLAQDVFIKVYYALDSFKARASFSTWLYRITVNLCIDEIRRQKRRWVNRLEDEIPGEEGDERIPDESYNLEQEIERNETRDLVRRAISGLDEPYRTMLILRDLNELSYTEIAKIMRCRLGTVKSRLFTARMLLRDRLKPFMDNKR